MPPKAEAVKAEAVKAEEPAKDAGTAANGVTKVAPAAAAPGPEAIQFGTFDGEVSARTCMGELVGSAAAGTEGRLPLQ